MGYKILPYSDVREFCRKIFSCYGFRPSESEIITDVLLCADLYGIESHGIQRLIRYHNEIGCGMVDVGAQPVTVHDTPISAVIDANKAMGQIIGDKAMRLAIRKAKAGGIGMVSVRNSNHYGIAGYFAEMAAREDLMGVCMTNTEAIAVPTFGKKAMLGTSPIALAFPAHPFTFLYDAATTVVPRGKLEVYQKNGKPLPDGWAVDTNGRSCEDAGKILHNIINKLGGGIAPLGGSGEMFGGHKGYGLGIIVDIFTGILSSGMTSNHVNVISGQSDIAHFFMAADYGLFGNKAEIKERFSRFLRELRKSPKADGQNRIYTHGEKEFECKELRLRQGIPVNEKTMDEMRAIAESGHVEFKF